MPAVSVVHVGVKDWSMDRVSDWLDSCSLGDLTDIFKGPTEVLERYESEIRLKITEAVSDALHILQRQQQQSEPVYSDDNANYLCAALEAAFLHGLLPSVGQKVAMYIGSGTGPGVAGNLSFWNLVMKFTHSDVVSQLRQLNQINTEIGLSRAWIRTALNDGLIESYIGSVLADKRNLQKYYHKTAYLRDEEQPEILKTYFHGLVDFQFKLSCNSSVLNYWSALALSIAGLTDHDAPPPVIKPGSKGVVPRKQSGINAGDSLYTPVEARGVRTRSKGGSTVSSEGSRTRDNSFMDDFPDEDFQDFRYGLSLAEDENESLKTSSVKEDLSCQTTFLNSNISTGLQNSEVVTNNFSAVEDLDNNLPIVAVCDRSERHISSDTNPVVSTFTGSGVHSPSGQYTTPNQVKLEKTGLYENSEKCNHENKRHAFIEKKETLPKCTQNIDIGKDSHDIQSVGECSPNMLKLEKSGLLAHSEKCDDENKRQAFIEKKETSSKYTQNSDVSDDSHDNQPMGEYSPSQVKQEKNGLLARSGKCNDENRRHALMERTATSTNHSQNINNSDDWHAIEPSVEVTGRCDKESENHILNSEPDPVDETLTNGFRDEATADLNRDINKIGKTQIPESFIQNEEYHDNVLQFSETSRETSSVAASSDVPVCSGAVDDSVKSDCDKSNVQTMSVNSKIIAGFDLKTDLFSSDFSATNMIEDESPIEVISVIKSGKPKSPVKNKSPKKLYQKSSENVIQSECLAESQLDSNELSQPMENDASTPHTEVDDKKRLSPLTNSKIKRKTAIEPELSNVILTRTDVVRERSNAFSSPVQMKKSLSELNLRNRSNVSTPRSLPSHNKNSIRRSSTGNCLKNLNSWSSSFDGISPDTSLDSDGITFQAAAQDSTDTGIPIRRGTAESFGTLLQNYTPKQSASPSLNNIIEDLPTSDNSEFSSSKVVPDIDNIVGDYEVIHRYSGDYKMDNEFFETQMSYYGEIACERGLDSQNYQCKDCKRPIGLFYGKPRVCTYDCGYYCYECHENEESVIPSYVVHNWDFKKYLVSKRNYAFLIDNEDQPLLDLQKLNPKIYDHVPELSEIKKLRQQLCYLKAYLLTCKPSVAEDFKKSIWPREHLCDSFHIYTLADLLQVLSGQLASIVKKIIKSSTSHVYNCVLCSQKGFICEICSSSKVIYPFEVDGTYRCQCCKAVYHKACKTDDTPCPKCERYIHRQEKLGSAKPSFSTDFDDFSYEPT